MDVKIRVMRRFSESHIDAKISLEFTYVMNAWLRQN